MNVLDPSANRDRLLTDLLSFRDIETQYSRCVTAGTLAVWASTGRYGFDLIVTKVGRNSRVRRDRWEHFLDQRTFVAAMENSEGLQEAGR